MKLVVFGLSISSSWGNGHATTYRALLRAFAARGHEIVFYEWNAPWYAANRYPTTRRTSSAGQWTCSTTGWSATPPCQTCSG